MLGTARTPAQEPSATQNDMHARGVTRDENYRELLTRPLEEVPPLGACRVVRILVGAHQVDVELVAFWGAPSYPGSSLLHVGIV